jgi:ribonuclease HIII
MAKLRAICEARGWTPFDVAYTRFAFKADHQKVNVSAYTSGKVVIAGKGTEDFVRDVIEPEITGAAKLGYDDVLHPDWFEAHAGLDESGKGDFFGPLVIAGAYTNEPIARHLLEAGIRDSKSIGSDAQIRKFADVIRATPGLVSEVIVVSPEKYNPLYEKIGNLNRLLAWGHARVIENLCERKPDCPSALSDQFANPIVLQRALMEKGRKIELRQQTKAESDYAVAAASILAREKFIDWLADAEKKWGVKFPKGASAAVLEAARALIHQHGPDALRATAKLHFKTAQQALA